MERVEVASKYVPLWDEAGNKISSNYWESYSPKMSRKVCFFNDLDHDHWITIEANPRVKRFCEYPAKLTFQADGKEMSALFDMWILWSDGKEEFRIIGFPTSPKTIGKPDSEWTKRVEGWCREHGATFSYINEERVRANPLFISNCKRALKFLVKSKMREEHALALMAKIRETEGISIADVLGSNNQLSEEDILNGIFWLLFSGKISSDLEQRQLSKNTLLYGPS